MIDKKINFSAKKTEAQWIETIDNFYLAATPKFFEWLGWVAALSAISYLSIKSPSVSLAIVKVVGYILLWGYFQAYFYKIKFSFNESWSNKMKLGVSLTISFLLSIGAYIFVNHVLFILASNQP